MSRKRGGPPDLKSTLGSLLRTTLDQIGVVKDVVEQQTRSTGGIFDQALQQRRKKEAMTRLGEAVYSLHLDGKLEELGLFPEVGTALSAIDAAEEEEDISFVPRPDSSDREAVSSANYRPPTRNKPSEEFRVWRPVVDPGEPEDLDPKDHDVELQEANAVTSSMATPESKSGRIPRKIAEREKGGGIRFVQTGPRPGDPDSDDDLESYMHEDDV